MSKFDRNNQLPVIIIGSGGYSKVLIDILNLSNRNIIGITSKNMNTSDSFYGVKILGDDEIIFNYSPEDIELVNAIGSLPNENRRWDVANYFRNQKYRFSTLVHPHSYIASNCSLSEGVQVMAGAIIQSEVFIGKDCIINSGCIIDHECKISECCHLAPGVVFSGNVKVGSYTFIGTGTRIINNISIGEKSIIAAGSSIYRDISPGILYKQKLQINEKSI